MTQFFNGFPKLFYNNSRGFRKYMMLGEHTKALWTKESRWEIYKKKISEKYNLSERVSL